MAYQLRRPRCARQRGLARPTPAIRPIAGLRDGGHRWQLVRLISCAVIQPDSVPLCEQSIAASPRTDPPPGAHRRLTIRAGSRCPQACWLSSREHSPTTTCGHLRDHRLAEIAQKLVVTRRGASAATRHQRHHGRHRMGSESGQAGRGRLPHTRRIRSHFAARRAASQRSTSGWPYPRNATSHEWAPRGWTVRTNVGFSRKPIPRRSRW